MRRALVTGMSGTGTSGGRARAGGAGSSTPTTAAGPTRSTGCAARTAMAALLAGHRSGALFVAGCVENQGRFAACFEHVVLLSAPIDVLLVRVAARTSNPYGMAAHEIAEIRRSAAEATVEIDTTAPLHQVVARLEHLVSAG